MNFEQLVLYGPDRAYAPSAVMTAHHGRNDAMIAKVARLYIPDGATVLDVTWGKGNFWTRTDTSRFRLTGADLASPSAHIRADFRALPFAGASTDVIVFDPPYVHSTTQPRFIHGAYRNNETTPGKTYAAIIGLYRDGMAEALRVLRPGGTCWVKCQDTVEGRQQQWSVITIHALALNLGFEGAQDLFVLVNPTPPGGTTAQRQYHARRNHSYLWIFRKRP